MIWFIRNDLLPIGRNILLETLIDPGGCCVRPRSFLSKEEGTEALIKMQETGFLPETGVSLVSSETLKKQEKNMNGAPVSSSVALWKYFGPSKEGQTLREFSVELKSLSEDEKDELAALAAAELGLTLK